ncbi:hypothetical protein [Rubinisphaera margarita]|uniref:hypothetical protein n=1 Tax=Rubinisphaera margarita TaxID=2909586 RepID=UPI001EE8EBB1|nr:hypothetical protein [Rubinisphaera margarita]MCG6155001.1 hypothetical protein [Rubinisphaera margarita]
MTLTAEQIELLRKGESVRVSSPELGEEIVIVLASLLDEEQNDDDLHAIAELARRGRNTWASENSF